MPVFEYKCHQCDTKFEVLHKSALRTEEVSCPDCNSTNNKKLFSAFSASVSSSSISGGNSCSTGNCDSSTPSYGGCSSGMCGIN